MTAPVILMQNVLATRFGVLDRQTLRALLVAATQAGRLEPDARAWLEALAWPPACRAELAAFCQQAEAGEAVNPEVGAMRACDPHFDARVAAIAAHARPGDVIAWTSDQPGLPWSLMRACYGPWMHVSIVLDDGLLLDPYWPEGWTISTPAAAVAKSFARVKANAFVITRLADALPPEALAALCAEARAGLGKPYSFVARLDRPSAHASCSRIAWELFRAQGRDLAPDEGRMYKTAIAPQDMVLDPVAFVHVDGRVELDPQIVPPPDGIIAFLTRCLDGAMHALPGFQDFMFGFQAPVTWLFMTGMATLGREIRPGFSAEALKLEGRLADGMVR
ncbi:MAG: Permuted papain-like amidase enzyme YaeF/YiiX, family [Cyanobacteria bacterium RYN_339]|nr:Permuted papain-like amidase enzyme YaeF/YiiX, family [Cyanobacteria bacterium RYN_339]